MNGERLEAIADKTRTYFSAKHRAREQSIVLSREVIRGCANAIRAVHRGDEELAGSLLDGVRSSLQQVHDVLRDYPDLSDGGFVNDAQKEFAEASITRAVVSGQDLPDPDELGTSYPAYLNGMGEAVGELRRQVLDAIRKGEAAKCEHLLSIMDDFYSVLTTMDFPDALTYGLRRTTDVVRGILEKTRGDLTMAMSQKDLERRMVEFEQRLNDRLS